MDIINRIRKKDFRPSKSDRILIEYVNLNAGECIYKSITEIAKEVSLGEATVTRFSRKLGFLGFQEFKVALTKELSKESGKNVISTVVNVDEKANMTAEKLFTSYKEVMEKTLQNLNYNNILAIKNLILQAKKIFFFGIGNSGIVAMDANYKFMRIGLNSMSVSDSHTMIMLSSLMNKDDILFAISHTGETKEILKTVEVAKQNEVRIISLTGSNSNSLIDLSDINVNYVSVETIFETGSILSKLVQIFLMELIYSEVIKDNYENSIENKVKTTEALEKFKFYK